jgi:Pyruvate/2-oxoacid:ferredoxin oxidoreductase delta subunit
LCWVKGQMDIVHIWVWKPAPDACISTHTFLLFWCQETGMEYYFVTRQYRCFINLSYHRKLWASSREKNLYWIFYSVVKLWACKRCAFCYIFCHLLGELNVRDTHLLQWDIC